MAELLDNGIAEHSPKVSQSDICPLHGGMDSRTRRSRKEPLPEFDQRHFSPLNDDLNRIANSVVGVVPRYVNLRVVDRSRVPSEFSVADADRFHRRFNGYGVLRSDGCLIRNQQVFEHEERTLEVPGATPQSTCLRLALSEVGTARDPDCRQDRNRGTYEGNEQFGSRFRPSLPKESAGDDSRPNPSEECAQKNAIPFHSSVQREAAPHA